MTDKKNEPEKMEPQADEYSAPEPLQESELNDDDSEGLSQLQDILQTLPQELLVGELVDRLEHPEGRTRSRIEIRQRTTSKHFSGPLPPPEVLAGFENTQNGSADRVITMAEKEQDHRHTIEKTGLEGAIAKDRRGQNYALIICLVILLGSMGLIAIDKEISGTLLAGSSLTGLAYIFITGRKEEKDKSEE